MRRKDLRHALRLVVCSSLIDEQLSATCHMTPDDFPALSLCYLSWFCPWCPGWAATSAWCWKRWEETLLHGFTATPFSTSVSASLSQWWTKDSVSPSTTDGSRRTAATSGSSPAPPSPLMPRMPVRRTSFGSTTSSGWWSPSLHLSCIENARTKASLGQKMIERSFYFQCKVKQG